MLLGFVNVLVVSEGVNEALKPENLMEWVAMRTLCGKEERKYSITHAYLFKESFCIISDLHRSIN